MARTQATINQGKKAVQYSTVLQRTDHLNGMVFFKIPTFDQTCSRQIREMLTRQPHAFNNVIHTTPSQTIAVCAKYTSKYRSFCNLKKKKKMVHLECQNNYITCVLSSRKMLSYLITVSFNITHSHPSLILIIGLLLRVVSNIRKYTPWKGQTPDRVMVSIIQHTPLYVTVMEI